VARRKPRLTSTGRLQLLRLFSTLLPITLIDSSARFFSDGFLEVTNDRGEEFGWGRLERVILENAAEPLTQIIARLVDETIHFGSQRDDQTILLVKAAQHGAM